MRKRNIAFILFAVGGINLITIPITLIIYAPLYARLGMPSYAMDVAFMAISASGIIAASALFLDGLIVLIKFRKT